jgi:hypothetical protein
MVGVASKVEVVEVPEYENAEEDEGEVVAAASGRQHSYLKRHRILVKHSKQLARK